MSRNVHSCSPSGLTLYRNVLPPSSELTTPMNNTNTNTATERYCIRKETLNLFESVHNTARYGHNEIRPAAQTSQLEEHRMDLEM